MKPRTLLLLGCAALAAGLLAWRFVPFRKPAGDPAAPPSPAPPASATKPGLNTATDAAAVFQRAFWRRPDASVRILHAERRELADEKTRVQSWQWFIALEARPEFRRWLLEENPFGLVRLGPDASVPEFASPPSWFPAPAALGGLVAYRVPGSGFHAFVDANTGRIFATDSGGGFAAGRR